MHGNLKCMSCEAKKNKLINDDLLNEIGGYSVVDDEGNIIQVFIWHHTIHTYNYVLFLSAGL